MQLSLVKISWCVVLLMLTGIKCSPARLPTESSEELFETEKPDETPDETPEEALVTSRNHAIFLLLVGAHLCGISPLFLQRFLSRKRIQKLVISTMSSSLSTLICFVGGILISSVFVVHLPLLRETEDNSESSVPVAELMIAFGFATVFLIRKIIFMGYKKIFRIEDDLRFLYMVHFTWCRAGDDGFVPQYPSGSVSYAPDSDAEGDDPITREEKRRRWRQIELFAKRGIYLEPNGDYLFPRAMFLNPALVDSWTREGDTEFQEQQIRADFLVRRERMLERQQMQRMRPKIILVMTILMFHSLTDGFSLGIQRTPIQTWLTFGGLAVNRFLISSLTSLELLLSNFSTKDIVLAVGGVSSLAPVGSLLAAYVAQAHPSGLYARLLNAFSAGSILYVIIFEVAMTRRYTVAFYRQLAAGVMGYLGAMVVFSSFTK